MSDEKANASKEAAGKKTGVDNKPAGEKVPGSKDHQDSATTRNVASSTAPITAKTADTAKTPDAKPWWSTLKVKKFVPVIVLLLAVGIFAGIAGGWNALVGGRRNQKTDDAFLRSDITPLSTRVSGTVAQVAVSDYQHVRTGDLLVQLKDDDFKAQVAQAEAAVAAARAALENNAKQKELQAARIMQAQAGTQAASAEILQSAAAIDSAKADVANAQAGVDVAQAKIPDAQAAVEAAQADAERTLLERKRQEALLDLGSATKQKVEQVVADQERHAAILDSRKAELSQTHALLESRRAELSKARAGVAAREAEHRRSLAQSSGRTAEVEAQTRQVAVLDAQEQQLRADLNAKEEALIVAQTNLDYTRIVAPTDGIVGERKVRVGQLVSPGTQVISLVENTIWVQANYKETQLTNVSKGDSAEITVDTFPGLVLRGHVEEIAPASGSQFALLPPDYATGNYTKVAQRIPVKIVLDLNPAMAERLRPGMSVIAEITTSTKRKG